MTHFAVFYTPTPSRVAIVPGGDLSPLPEWAQNGLLLHKEEDLDGVEKDLLLRIASAMSKEPVTALPPEPSKVLWGMLGDLQATVDVMEPEMAASTPGKAGKPARKRAEKSKKITKKSSTPDLEPGSASATSAAPEGTPPSAETKEATMAKQTKKTAAKNAKPAKGKAKPKAAPKAKAPRAKQDGLRPGSKKQMLVDLVSRKSGATMEELLKATGWKACRGTLGEAVATAGKKLVVDKEGKVARYYAK